ncbi:MAG: tRNA (adenosine(37)-N6)-dimethylallyltransferase MiaA [Christensenellales bacterium]|jgi:tRNA dimethylallyltransferase
MNKPIIAVVGATASGKSALSVQLAKKHNGVVISADSMQVYKGMDIGTGKVTEEEKEEIPHFMIDVVSPMSPYNVAMYRDMAKKIIEQTYSRNQIPIICGGTGLYVNALLYPMGLTGKESTLASREKWQCRLKTLGADGLHQLLSEMNPTVAEKIHPNNTRRVIRALEIIENGGEESEALAEAAYVRRDFSYRNTVIIGLRWQRAELRQRIFKRVDLMLRSGLLDETRALLSQGVDPGGTAMQGLGYKQLIPVIFGTASLAQATEEIKLRTCQYAKRQLSWFRREKRTVWLDCDGKTTEKLVREAEAVIDG